MAGPGAPQMAPSGRIGSGGALAGGSLRSQGAHCVRRGRRLRRRKGLAALAGGSAGGLAGGAAAGGDGADVGRTAGIVEGPTRPALHTVTTTPPCEPKAKPLRARSASPLPGRRPSPLRGHRPSRLRSGTLSPLRARSASPLPGRRPGRCPAPPGHLGGRRPPHLRGPGPRHLRGGAEPFAPRPRGALPRLRRHPPDLHSSRSFASVPTNSDAKPSSSPPK